MKSLDPRVTRLPEIRPQELEDPTNDPEQFETYEVFVQPKAGRPFQHEGSVHAPNLALAYVLAKETFTRRFTCTSIFVVATCNVHVSPITEGDQNVYDLIQEASTRDGEKISFEVFHLRKRGKQHVQVGTVNASSVDEAFWCAKTRYNSDGNVFNVWVIRATDIRYTTDEERDLWATLPEKKFRDAIAYKGGDKLSEFLSRSKHHE